MMQRHGQLDHAQARAEVAAGLRDGVDHLGAHFVSELSKFSGIEPAHVPGIRDLVEQRRDWRHV